MVPLSLLPGPVQALAELLPFRWMLAFPVELLLGRLTPAEALSASAPRLAWLAVALPSLRARLAGAAAPLLGGRGREGCQ